MGQILSILRTRPPSGGDQIRALPRSPKGSPEEEGLKQKLREALRPLYRLGISPVDADVVNCHVTDDGCRVILVDHGQDEVFEPLSGSELDERVEEKTEGIISQHRQLRGLHFCETEGMLAL